MPPVTVLSISRLVVTDTLLVTKTFFYLLNPVPVVIVAPALCGWSFLVV